jgi:branched-chain amino acid aminotransferase
MAVGNNIWTYFNGAWQQGNTAVMGAADHGMWLGTLVFDGARLFEGATPDLDRHCERVNQSARSMGLEPSVTTTGMVEIALEGLKHFDAGNSAYIRPMYWSTESGPAIVDADPESTRFCLCLEELPMPPADATTTLGQTTFVRPTLQTAMVNTKAACLYPHNARMLREVNARGFKNAIVCDSLGNVAESATSNLMMVRDGEVFTPVPNGTFLNGITRQRFTELLRADGHTVHETTLSINDFLQADEVFLTGNATKITPVTQIEDKHYQSGQLARRARELYWDWALGQ